MEVPHGRCSALNAHRDRISARVPMRDGGAFTTTNSRIVNMVDTRPNIR